MGWGSGSRQSRGYDANHDRERARLLPLAYGSPCPICGLVMLEGQRLELDHVIPLALGGYNGPRRMVHRECNRARGRALGLAQQQRARWQARGKAARW